ncbi:MAG: ketoacyl-ACP synthase III [Alphaproteobacteria bacterium]|nr:ketoacyl-ACP synthase III [Alphaproteobacteria bacterium]
MSEIFSEIIGTGSYLPEKILTNDDLSKMVDTSDEWIFTRTGIKKRHIAADDECTSDLAVKAIQNALDSAKVSAEDVDLLVVATITPDLVFPSTSCIIQKKLGLKNAVAFDISAACSGFVYGLTVADSMIKSGNYKTVVVVGVETLTRIMDWNDRTTCVLFGDGAGAAVLRATTEKTGILSYSIKSDGNYLDCLKATGGPSSTKTSGNIYMEGKEVFKLAVVKMPEISKEVVEKAGMTMADVDCFIPHQANIRIIDAALKNLDIPEEKVVKTIENHGNISSACIPLALDIANKSGQLKKGQNVLLTAMGAGFTWGSVFLKF